MCMLTTSFFLSAPTKYPKVIVQSWELTHHCTSRKPPNFWNAETRRWRYLSPRTSKHHVLIFYDTEAHYKDPRELLLIGFHARLADGSEYVFDNILKHENVYYLDNIPDFVALMKSHFVSQNIPIYFIAHNGGGWDHFYIYRYFVHIPPGSVHKANLKYYNSPDGLIHFRDTVMYFPGKLNDMGALFGIQKLDCDYTECRPGNMVKLIPYCARDVEILYTVWNRFEKDILPVIGLGKHKLIDFNSYAHYSWCAVAKNIEVELYIFSDWKLYTLLKQCYYGGLVGSNCWGQYISKDLAMYDITSMYPASLLNDFPYGQLTGPIYNFKPTQTMYIGWVRLFKEKTDCIDAQHPIVPVKVGTELQWFAAGEIYGMYTSVDIETFIMAGWEVTHIAVYCYASKGKYLANFYQTCFDNRIKSDSDVMKYVWKIMMNSSYGKFGQYKHSNEHSILEKYHPVAWFTTSYARRQLFKLNKMLPVDLFYTDTDSFVIEKTVPVPPECLQKKLGCIQNDEVYFNKERESTYLCVASKKCYSMDGLAKCKGASNCTEHDIISLLDSEKRLPIKKCKYHWTSNTTFYLDPVMNHHELKRVIVPSNYFLCMDCKLYHTKFAAVE